MTDNAIKPLDIAAGVLITLLVLSLGFLLYKNASRFVIVINDSINESSTSISESTLLKYDQTVVSGSDVIACIRANKEDLVINVAKIVDKANPGAVVWSTTKPNKSITNGLLDANGVFRNDPGGITASSTYINPNAEYVGTVIRNDNDVICEIEFSQLAYLDDVSYIAASGGNNMNAGTGGSSTDAESQQLAMLQTSINNLSSALTDRFNSLSNMISGIGSSGGSSSGGTSSGGLTKEDVEEELTAAISGLKDDIEEMLAEISTGDSEGVTFPGLSDEEIADIVDGIIERLEETGTGDDPDAGSGDTGSDTDLEEQINDLQDSVSNILLLISYVYTGEEDVSKLWESIDAGDLQDKNVKALVDSIASIQQKLDSLEQQISASDGGTSTGGEGGGGTGE